jgi:flagellar FliJ protein
MTKSERLQPIVRVSESKERQAARMLAEALKRHQEVETRLKELLTYRGEYDQLFQRNSVSGVGAEKLRDYRAFIAQLNQAIGYQELKVSAAVAACEAARSAWLKTRTRCQALGKVVDGHRRDERRSEARREQKDSDELAHGMQGKTIVDEDE